MPVWRLGEKLWPCLDGPRTWLGPPFEIRTGAVRPQPYVLLIAHTACGALHPARYGPSFTLGADPFVLQILFADTTPDMIPGKDLRKRSGSKVKILVDAISFKGSAPQVPPKRLAPTIKAAAHLEGIVDYLRQLSITSGEYAFQKAQLRGMPLEPDSPPVKPLSQYLLPHSGLF